MKPVTVAAFNSLSEAQALKERLATAGIAAEIRSEPSVDPSLDFSRAGVGVHVAVPRAEFEAALRLVYDWNAKPPTESAPPGQSGVRPRGPAFPRAGSGSPV